MKKLLLIAVVGVLFAGSSFAQIKTPNINRKQIKQHVRIHKGIQSGKITKKEARFLTKQQRKIQRAKLIAKTDGIVTRAERRHIHKIQARASKNIFRVKQNSRLRS